MAVETYQHKVSMRWTIAINGTPLKFLPWFEKEEEAELYYKLEHPTATVVTTEDAQHHCNRTVATV